MKYETPDAFKAAWVRLKAPDSYQGFRVSKEGSRRNKVHYIFEESYEVGKLLDQYDEEVQPFVTLYYENLDVIKNNKPLL